MFSVCCCNNMVTAESRVVSSLVDNNVKFQNGDITRHFARINIAIHYDGYRTTLVGFVVFLLLRKHCVTYLRQIILNIHSLT